MTRSLPSVAVLLACTLVLPGCATLQQMSALRFVAFEFDHIGEVRLAGVPIGAGTRFTNLGVADAARIGAAISMRDVPFECDVHVRATNPVDNRVTARLVNVDWKLFLDERETVGGTMSRAVAIEPGRTADVPVAVRFDLMRLATGGARDVFDLALAIAGYGAVAKDVRLELVPTIDTTLGPIRYTSPVSVRRIAR